MLEPDIKTLKVVILFLCMSFSLNSHASLFWDCHGNGQDAFTAKRRLDAFGQIYDELTDHLDELRSELAVKTEKAEKGLLTDAELESLDKEFASYEKSVAEQKMALLNYDAMKDRYNSHARYLDRHCMGEFDEGLVDSFCFEKRHKNMFCGMFEY